MMATLPSGAQIRPSQPKSTQPRDNHREGHWQGGMERGLPSTWKENRNNNNETAINKDERRRRSLSERGVKLQSPTTASSNCRWRPAKGRAKSLSIDDKKKGQMRHQRRGNRNHNCHCAGLPTWLPVGNRGPRDGSQVSSPDLVRRLVMKSY